MAFSLSKETLGFLIKNFKDNADTDADLAEYLYRVQEEVKTVRHRISQADADMHAEEDRNKTAKQAIGLNIKVARDSCKHYQTTYYPDASGNNDSSIECDICGKSLTRAERRKWMKL